MRYFFLIQCWAFLVVPIFPQKPVAQQEDFNLKLLSHQEIEFPAETDAQFKRYADIWGYAGAAGTEYAILGTGIGTAIFDLTDPSNPTLAALVPGTLSRWRDFKTWGNYIYGVADEGKDGLLIIDMTEAPTNITWSYWTPTLALGSDEAKTLERCHNLYIDSTFVFLAGCNLYGGGVMIFDLAQNPLGPALVSVADRRYAHDVYAEKDRMYTSDLSQGFAIVDISDIRNPKTLVSLETSRDFTHNAWASDDASYLFTTDERSSATVDAYDIRNLDEIKLIDQYRPSATLRNPVIPHNVHYHQGYLVISYYTDGVKIVDAHEPDNLVEVGSYDTYKFRDDGFHGAWGAFPFLPSGLILVSDIESGLYVFEPTYQRAAYLQGTVTDESNGSAISGATIAIDSEKPGTESTGPNGQYKMGWAGQGTATLTFSKIGYAPVTMEAELMSGAYTTIDVQLRPLSTLTFTGNVVDSATNNAIGGAQIIAFNDTYQERTTTDAQGAFSLNVLEGNYTVAAGLWGYHHQFVIAEITENIADIELKLRPGYRDDFVFDYGWTVSNSRGTGANQGWQKGVPEYAIYNEEFANPNGDLPDDFGKEAYLTGLAGNLGANLSDTSVLLSPIFDLSNYNDPYLNYYIWFYDLGVFAGDDDLKIYLSNGAEEVLLETVNESSSRWRDRSELRTSDFLPPSNNMQLRLVAADQGIVHIYEAGIDAFSISEGQTTSVSREEFNQFASSVYPNPFSSVLYVETSNPVKTLSIYDLAGNKIYGRSIAQGENMIDLNFLSSGYYVVKLTTADGLISRHKVVKMR